MTIASSSLGSFDDSGGLQHRHPGIQLVQSRPAFAQEQVVFARREHLANRVHSQHLWSSTGGSARDRLRGRGLAVASSSTLSLERAVPLLAGCEKVMVSSAPST